MPTKVSVADALFVPLAAILGTYVYGVARPAAQVKDAVPCIPVPAQSDFVGKWEAAQGNGQGFSVTLYAYGRAWKSTGPGDGDWKWVDGEAGIDWDDGWHDAIVRVGSHGRFLKLGYEPGKKFEGTPSNIGPAHRVGPAS